MKINVIKPHAKYEIGEHEVTEERGKYLVSMQVAELAEEESMEDIGDHDEEEETDHSSDESNDELVQIEPKKRGRKKKIQEGIITKKK